MGLGVVFVQSLAALGPATATAAVALPDHPGKPTFSEATAAQLAPEVTKLLGSWNEGNRQVEDKESTAASICVMFSFIKSLTLVYCDIVRNFVIRIF